ncbi:MAG: thiamine phosphate synthase [Hydrogenovibrio sp.]|uniref:thiamine phosphate synthase n=1 Tax=Hydrogenovibrio sp. TaxID=2065821 RepID=UPI002870ADC9|nr:thiamine phosphate synthase [Hydrogenovibrio sp.]MDR9498310.1 thiamine phosphate synthase [Hydrogenovibrio sp.]
MRFASLPTLLGIYPLVESAQKACAMANAGARVVQLRIKNRPIEKIEAEVALACRLMADMPCQLIINDHWALAIRYGADGVHLGQEDLSEVHDEILSQLSHAGLALGLSSHTLDEITRAQLWSPSYLAIGPIFESPSKRLPYPAVGMDRLTQWVQTVPCPVIAIGGIQARHLPQLGRSGTAGVAMIDALQRADDPVTELRSLQSLFDQAWSVSHETGERHVS